MPRLETKVHSYINWSWGTKDIINFIKSFDDPYPGARTFLDKKLVIVRSAKIEKKLYNFHPFQTGIIFRKKNETYYVACKNYAISLKIFSKKNNKKIIDKVLGKRLYTPSKYLELALTSKSIHLPKGIIIK
jgi:methionyl-tRNA formyltransferase